METTGTRNTVENTHNSENLKVCLYYPVLDAMITELKKRFDSKNLELMRAFQCCVPESPHFLEVKQRLFVHGMCNCQTYPEGQRHHHHQ